MPQYAFSTQFSRVIRIQYKAFVHDILLLHSHYIYGIKKKNSIFEKGGSVGPMKQLIKLTWPYNWYAI